MGKSVALKRPGKGPEKYQVIRDGKGVPAFAVVPWTDFQRLLDRDDETATLIAAGNAARNDVAFPADVAARLIAGETPLKAIREWRGLTQDVLAEMTGVSAQYISQLERRDGGRNVGRKVGAKLAAKLKVPVEALMEFE